MENNTDHFVQAIVHHATDYDDSYQGIDITQNEYPEVMEKWRGLPVMPGHDYDQQPFGFVINYESDDKGQLIANMYVNSKHENGRKVIDQLDAGEKVGVSLGTINLKGKKPHEVVGIAPQEVSFTTKPARPGTYVQKYTKGNKVVVVGEKMSSTENTAPPTTNGAADATPPQAAPVSSAPTEQEPIPLAPQLAGMISNLRGQGLNDAQIYEYIAQTHSSHERLKQLEPELVELSNLRKKREEEERAKQEAQEQELKVKRQRIMDSAKQLQEFSKFQMFKEEDLAKINPNFILATADVFGSYTALKEVENLALAKVKQTEAELAQERFKTAQLQLQLSEQEKQKYDLTGRRDRYHDIGGAFGNVLQQQPQQARGPSSIRVVQERPSLFPDAPPVNLTQIGSKQQQQPVSSYHQAPQQQQRQQTTTTVVQPQDVERVMAEVFGSSVNLGDIPMTNL